LHLNERFVHPRGPPVLQLPCVGHGCGVFHTDHLVSIEAEVTTIDELSKTKIEIEMWP
jgi:hypothetical protein